LELDDDNELADLTRAFASMTQQLAQARVAEQKTERVKAWNEVAQRVAHEIKNPLTPIQLSAERLAMKLAGKLEGADALLLNKSVKTSVDQVDAMKRLVNEFRDYARLPTAELKPISFQAVLADALQLYDHELLSGVIRVEQEALAPGLDWMIEGDAQQLCQALHNLLQNALDATRSHSQENPSANANANANAKVTVRTSFDSSIGAIQCVISDNGAGFAPHVLERAFEPYNTTKAKGTGLGLAVVRKTIQEHKGDIKLGNLSVDSSGTSDQATGDNATGAVVRLTFPHSKKGTGE
jgi:nitrogen fixation/metabolism regulation signal transduction histidine kinase